MLLVLLCTACGGKPSPVGTWRCASIGSESVIELTYDGDFIDHVSGAANKYRLQHGCIVTYVEDEPGSEVALPYEMRGGMLYIGDAAYERVENP